MVVDEVHAFARDDRGWHLLALLQRIGRLAGRDLQRIGLSATVGNEEELLEWLSAGSARPRRVIRPPAVPEPEPEVVLDYVGGLDNAAKVIATLHRGEKRLVFCDSRARVEQLAADLRARGVATFVSYSSLGLGGRVGVVGPKQHSQTRRRHPTEFAGNRADRGSSRSGPGSPRSGVRWPPPGGGWGLTGRIRTAGRRGRRTVVENRSVPLLTSLVYACSYVA